MKHDKGAVGIFMSWRTLNMSMNSAKFKLPREFVYP